MQQLADGGVGFGRVTDGLHAIRPEADMLHMVWALETLSTPLLEMATRSTATKKSFLTAVSINPASTKDRTSCYLFVWVLLRFGS